MVIYKYKSMTYSKNNNDKSALSHCHTPRVQLYYYTRFEFSDKHSDRQYDDSTINAIVKDFTHVIYSKFKFNGFKAVVIQEDRPFYNKQKIFMKTVLKYTSP